MTASKRRREKRAAELAELQDIYGIKTFSGEGELRAYMIMMLAAVYHKVCTDRQLLECCTASYITLKSWSDDSMKLIWQGKTYQIHATKQHLKNFLPERY